MALIIAAAYSEGEDKRVLPGVGWVVCRVDRVTVSRYDVVMTGQTWSEVVEVDAAML